jgi:hypothetical protein
MDGRRAIGVRRWQCLARRQDTDPANVTLQHVQETEPDPANVTLQHVQETELDVESVD